METLITADMITKFFPTSSIDINMIELSIGHNIDDN